MHLLTYILYMSPYSIMLDILAGQIVDLNRSLFKKGMKNCPAPNVKTCSCRPVMISRIWSVHREWQINIMLGNGVSWLLLTSLNV